MKWMCGKSLVTTFGSCSSNDFSPSLHLAPSMNNPKM